MGQRERTNHDAQLKTGHAGRERAGFRCGSAAEFPSGVTSKPTIEGHFKTDQWTITLDKNLFYLADCCCGNPNLDLVRSNSSVGLECLAV